MSPLAGTMVAAMVSIGIAAPAAHAEALWCAVIDQDSHRAFVSDVRTEDAISKSKAWRYSERFVEAVNGRYSTRLPRSDSACRVFQTAESGNAALTRWLSTAQRHGNTRVLQGTF